MLLKIHKDFFSKIKFFKSIRIYFCLLGGFSLVFSSFGFRFKEGAPKSFINVKSKLKVKINYNENPNKPDFFTKTETAEFIDFGDFKDLDGIWTGSYSLNEGSIVWTNPNISAEDSKRIFDLIYTGPYNIYLKFSLTDRLKELSISQENIQYNSINFEQVSNNQINYWAKASTKNWLEVIRGKVYRLKEDKLFTIFQTTVYEGKIPIYAFYGEAMLTKDKG